MNLKHQHWKNMESTKEEFFDVIDKMASDAMESGSPSNTRKAITAEDVKEIYKNLW